MKSVLISLLILASCATNKNSTMQTNFYVEKSVLMANKGELFLKDNTGHCHLLERVNGLLKSDVFRSHNPQLIPIFEKAKLMMENGETGRVFLP